jgi:hypothetical protein
MTGRHPSKPPARIPPSAVGSAAGRSPGGRPRTAPATVTATFESRTIRLPRKRHLHRRARSWFGWRPVDRLGAWVREVGLLVLGLLGVLVWVGSLCGTAVLVGGAS